MERKTVENVLMEMGMPVRLKGFTYITDAVLLLDTPEWKDPKWTALYYKIAMINHTTPTRVERAIRNAFASTRNRAGNYDILEHYIGFTNCENSNSITYLYKTIKLDFPEDTSPAKPTVSSQSPAAACTVAPDPRMEFTADMVRTIIRQTILEIMSDVSSNESA